MRLFIIIFLSFSYLSNPQIYNLSKCEDCFEIEVLDFNSEQDDISPFLYKNELIFSRMYTPRSKKNARIGSGHWSSYPLFQFFSVDIDTLDATHQEYLYTKPQLKSVWNDRFHDISINIATNDEIALITRNNILILDTLEHQRNKVFVKNLSNKNNSSLYGLPFNSDEYSTEFPCFGKTDNIIFFASNMPDGYGGLDLYYSMFENGQWSPPINLGSTINDEQDQSYPFYHQSTGRLYFSSKSYGSLGGYDIFYSKNTKGAYSKPVQLDRRINTSSDEISFFINSTLNFGYFSSNRSGGKGGLDIYSFRKP